MKEAGNSLDLQTISLMSVLEDSECYADPLLPRVFYTLLENSLRHGNNTAHNRISNEMDDDSYVLVLEDDEGGIPAQEKENIFCRKFYKNTGFSLFLSRDILQITNYSIQEKGKYGVGARFLIRIPKGSFRCHYLLNASNSPSAYASSFFVGI